MLTTRLINIFQLFSVTIETDKRKNVQENTGYNNVVLSKLIYEAYESKFNSTRNEILNLLYNFIPQYETGSKRLAERHINAIFNCFNNEAGNFKINLNAVPSSETNVVKSYFCSFVKNTLNSVAIAKMLKNYGNKENLENLIASSSYIIELFDVLECNNIMLDLEDILFEMLKAFKVMFKRKDINISNEINAIESAFDKADQSLLRFGSMHISSGVPSGKIWFARLHTWNVKRYLNNLINMMDDLLKKYKDNKICESVQMTEFMKAYGLYETTRWVLTSVIYTIHALSENGEERYINLNNSLISLENMIASIMCFAVVDNTPSKPINGSKTEKLTVSTLKPPIPNSIKKKTRPKKNKVTRRKAPTKKIGGNTNQIQTFDVNTRQVQASSANTRQGKISDIKENDRFLRNVILGIFIIGISAILVAEYIIYSRINRR